VGLRERWRGTILIREWVVVAVAVAAARAIIAPVGCGVWAIHREKQLEHRTRRRRNRPRRNRPCPPPLPSTIGETREGQAPEAGPEPWRCCRSGLAVVVAAARHGVGPVSQRCAGLLATVVAIRKGRTAAVVAVMVVAQARPPRRGGRTARPPGAAAAGSRFFKSGQYAAYLPCLLWANLVTRFST
jgi:hypothetical protein